MNRKNRLSEIWKGNGFAIALGVCVFAAVISSALAIHNMMGSLGAQSGSVSSLSQGQNGVSEPWGSGSEARQAGVAESGVPVQQTPSSSQRNQQPSASASGAAPETPQGSTAGPAVQEPFFSLPVDGKVSAAYSGDELVYNETLADWRTHNGIDITAASGAPVNAATAGRVTRAEQDGVWGTVVEIAATDEMTLRYCGLQEVAVAVGDQVTQGQQIGTLGELPAELAGEPHLHLEALRGGAYLDPVSLMK